MIPNIFYFKTSKDKIRSFAQALQKKVFMLKFDIVQNVTKLWVGLGLQRSEEKTWLVYWKGINTNKNLDKQDILLERCSNICYSGPYMIVPFMACNGCEFELEPKSYI